MPDQPTRHNAITTTIGTIRATLDKEISVDTLNQAKAELIALSNRRDLFNFETFPLPAGDGGELTYFMHCEDDDSYALYVNAGQPWQHYRPHNHGGAWAIIAAVQGAERHKLYRYNDYTLSLAGEIEVKPGTAVSLLPDGIHSIHASGGEPLLHLHLYATRLDKQGARDEFDADTGERVTFKLEDLGAIVDRRYS